MVAMWAGVMVDVKVDGKVILKAGLWVDKKVVPWVERVVAVLAEWKAGEKVE